MATFFVCVAAYEIMVVAGFFLLPTLHRQEKGDMRRITRAEGGAK